MKLLCIVLVLLVLFAFVQSQNCGRFNCSSGQKCCRSGTSSRCCPSDGSCCGTGCCRPKTRCCFSARFPLCCPEGTTCCGSTCCASTQRCENQQRCVRRD
eukprot:gene8574-399_t